MKELTLREMGPSALSPNLRTDSTRIADEADAAAREYISANYGKEYAAARH